MTFVLCDEVAITTKLGHVLMQGAIAVVQKLRAGGPPKMVFESLEKKALSYIRLCNISSR